MIRSAKKKFIKYGAIGVAAVVCIAVLISFMRSSVNRKDLVFSEVDNGTIEVSVSASGKVVPAFEEIINHLLILVSWKFTVREETVWM